MGLIFCPIFPMKMIMRPDSASCTILSSIAHCAPSMTGSSVRFSAMMVCACQREDGIERLGRDAHGLPVHLGTQFLRHAAHGLVRHVQTDLGQDAHGCIVNAYALVVAQYADIRLNLIHGLALLFFLSTSLPDFPAADNGICSLFAVILCTFARVSETTRQTKKNPHGLHFRRGSSRERRFELEI